ncbi:hypothetical protein D1007_09301 [Hordeum vulgare]|nr:hypothetical protein D1007_09301 [Hordeum vulgare]
MFARHKEKENFHVRLQINVLEHTFGPRMAGAPSRAEPSRRNGISSQNGSVSARRHGGSTSVGTGCRVPLEVEPNAYNAGVDEEKLYSDVIQNLRRAPRAENQYEDDNVVRVDDDVVGEDEDLAAVEWDPLNPHMEEDPAFIECFEEGFDENVGLQPVAAIDDENDGQHSVASDEDFDEVSNDDGQQPHDFDDDPKYPPNDGSSEAPNGDPSEAPNGDQPSVVLCGRFEEDA